MVNGGREQPDKQDVEMSQKLRSRPILAFGPCGTCSVLILKQPIQFETGDMVV